MKKDQVPAVRYTPGQNGVAKRRNRSIVKAAQAMLEEKSFPKFYWAEVVRTTSWYVPSTPDLDSNPSIDDEVSEAVMPTDEPEVGTRKECPILFRLSGPNGRLSRFDQSEDEPASSGDSVVHSPCRKSRTRLTRKEKGKKRCRILARIGTSRTNVS